MDWGWIIEDFECCYKVCGCLLALYDKMWSTGEENGKPLEYSCLENPMNGMRRPKDMTLADELPRLVGAQYATAEEWRKRSRRNEEAKPKQKLCPAVDVSGGESKV